MIVQLCCLDALFLRQNVQLNIALDYLKGIVESLWVVFHDLDDLVLYHLRFVSVHNSDKLANPAQEDPSWCVL